jgi:hypothetical protein
LLDHLVVIVQQPHAKVGMLAQQSLAEQTRAKRILVG